MRYNRAPQNWAMDGLCDYWIVCHPSGILVAGNAQELADYGWTTTALSSSAGTSAGDFLSAADDDPPYLDFNASGDLLLSPLMFGNYEWKQLVARLTDQNTAPTKLVLECYAAFPTASAVEVGSGFGFSAGTPGTATNQAALIVANGTNFLLRNDLTSDTGAAIDNAWHLWKIQVDATNTEWWIDSVSQGTIATKADIWPSGFAVRTATTNRVRLAWAHIYPLE